MHELNPTALRKDRDMTVATTKIDTLVVGAGQAGVAMSEHLSKQGVPHLVLERSRIAERWRTGRWDSLVANGPAWHDRFPGLQFDDVPADGLCHSACPMRNTTLCAATAPGQVVSDRRAAMSWLGLWYGRQEEAHWRSQKSPEKGQRRENVTA